MGGADAFVLRLREPGWLRYTAAAGNGPDDLTLRRNGDMLEVFEVEERARTL